jgi:hypothetical protein
MSKSKKIEIFKDILYEMKQDFGFDVDDVVINSNLHFLLNDVWEAGKEEGRKEGYAEGWEKAMGRFANPDVG